MRGIILEIIQLRFAWEQWAERGRGGAFDNLFSDRLSRDNIMTLAVFLVIALMRKRALLIGIINEGI